MAMSDIVRLPVRLISNRTAQTTTTDNLWVHACKWSGSFHIAQAQSRAGRSFLANFLADQRLTRASGQVPNDADL